MDDALVAMDWADARRRMVDGQLRPNKVTDPGVLSAMRDLPRERFLPPGLACRAYADEDVALPGGGALLAPMALARLLQLAEPRAGDRALLVGAGSGYGAAVLARMGARVTALGSGAAGPAEALLAGLLPAGAIRWVAGPLPAGWPEGAPYDVLVIEGEVPAVPDSLIGQLAEGGRLVAVEAAGRRAGHAVLLRRLGGTVSRRVAFDCAAPPLRSFAPEPGFVF